jgi:hypothetical protein
LHSGICRVFTQSANGVLFSLLLIHIYHPPVDFSTYQSNSQHLAHKIVPSPADSALLNHIYIIVIQLLNVHPKVLILHWHELCFIY